MQSKILMFYLIYRTEHRSQKSHKVSINTSSGATMVLRGGKILAGSGRSTGPTSTKVFTKRLV